MPYHSHKLNSVSHSHIIGRTDPITGDSVKENDRVVFCANCQSCFLEDSWKYMTERHCEQNKTLDSVPALPSKLIAKKRKEEVIAELKNKGINLSIVASSVLLSLFISFFTLIILSLGSDIKYSLINSLYFTVLIGVLSAIASSTDWLKNFLGDDKNDVRIFRSRIELGKDVFSLNDIKQLKYQREILISQTSSGHKIESYTPILLVYFNEGGVMKQDLATDDYHHNKIFLMGLEEISHFIEIFFYSENISELRTMSSIQAQSTGNIEVGEPRKLLDYYGRLTWN